MTDEGSSHVTRGSQLFRLGILLLTGSMVTSVAITVGVGSASPAGATASNSQNPAPNYLNWAKTKANYPCYATKSYSCTTPTGYDPLVNGKGSPSAKKTDWAWREYGPGQASVNSFGYHNCTLYVAYRLESEGVPDPGVLGFARDWASKASSKHILVDQTPAQGAIAQWNVAGGGLGHVAYVESVDPGNAGITITEDNFVPSNAKSFPGGYTAEIHIKAGSKVWPANFIHFIKTVPGVKVFSGVEYGFNGASAIALDGPHVWVANTTGDSVTEMNSANGAFIRKVFGGKYFVTPTALAVVGSHLWIVNNGTPHGSQNFSITELNTSNGSRVRTITNANCPSCDLFSPYAMTSDGSNLWVTNEGNSITELNASNGSWVRTITNKSCVQCGIGVPVGIAFAHSQIWITNWPFSGPYSVIVLNASTGGWVKTLSGGSYGFVAPGSMAYDGTHLWVTNDASSGVTEVNTSDGSWVRTISGGSYGFNVNSPCCIAFDGHHLWVANSYGNSTTELNASDGSLVKTLTGDAYGLDFPAGIFYGAAHVWVASGNVVSEIATT